jgi:hypothetical protein
MIMGVLLLQRGAKENIWTRRERVRGGCGKSPHEFYHLYSSRHVIKTKSEKKKTTTTK